LEKEKGLREQAEARHIQRALLPEQEPQIPGYAIDGFCLQLNAVGGDWYDYVDLGDGLWGIALGDVCGKGMAAALLMAATRSLFRMAAEGSESPSDALTRLNQALLKDLPEGRFVTLVYSILDTKRATVRVANGGHPYPIFVREQTDITELKTEKGLPLGLMNSEYSEIGLTLQTGDRVLMYTDGTVEATNRGGQEYGTSRLVKSLQKPRVSAQSVLTEVQEFASGGTLSDDATALVLRRE
jgi:phosphoserine phosphatase RsbU/P